MEATRGQKHPSEAKKWNQFIEKQDSKELSPRPLTNAPKTPDMS